MQKVADTGQDDGLAFDRPVQNEVLQLKTLVGRIIGSEPIATQFLLQVIPAGEHPTIDNVRDRLRCVIESSFVNVLGISTVRLSRLQAALELGKHLYAPATGAGVIVNSAAVAANVVQSAIGWAAVEQLAVLALNCQYRLLSWKILTVGSATETIVPPTAIFQYLIGVGATHYIIAHNHPSGETSPSPEDCSLTQSLMAASRLLTLDLLDHLVVSRGQYVSIRSCSNLWQSSSQNSDEHQQSQQDWLG